MFNYTFLTKAYELEGKKVKRYREVNFNGVLRTILLTEDSCVLAKSYSAMSHYDSDYVEDIYFTSVEELFSDVDHALVDLLINEEEYDFLTRKEEERYRLEEEAQKKEEKRIKYEEYLKLKEEFEA